VYSTAISTLRICCAKATVTQSGMTLARRSQAERRKKALILEIWECPMMSLWIGMKILRSICQPFWQTHWRQGLAARAVRMESAPQNAHNAYQAKAAVDGY